MNNNVFAQCPNCGEQLSIPANMHIRAKCPRCQSMLEVNNGHVVNFTRPQSNPFGGSGTIDPNIAARRKKRRKVMLISLGVFVLLICAYVFVGRDYFAYREAVTDDSEYGIYDCDAYIWGFPNGFWIDEVKAHRDDLSYKKAQKYAESETCSPCKCESYNENYLNEYGKDGIHKTEAVKALEECDYKDASSTRDLRKVTLFLERHPNSSHLAEMQALRKQLWEGVIERFDANVAASGSSQGATFFRNVLVHLKDHNQSTIFVRFAKTLDLRDWKDFPSDSREILDALVDRYNELPSYERDISGNIPRPTDSPPPSLKDYFTAGNIETMEREVADAVSNSFVRLFKDTIIYVKRLEPDSQLHSNTIVINMDYSIKNKMNEIGGMMVPSLYQKTSQEQYGITKTFDGHILGIGIDFKFRMSMPNGGASFSFSESAEPASEIDDIDTISDAYEKMTYSAFGDFLGKINRNLGIHTEEDDVTSNSGAGNPQ